MRAGLRHHNEFMSLTPRQRRHTASELRANLRLAGLNEAQLAQKTGWTPERVAATLDVEGASPVDVWLLRDLLTQGSVKVLSGLRGVGWRLW